MRTAFSFIFRTLIILYQKIFSPLLQKSCRYTPSCSQYGLEAIAKYGPWEGVGFIIKRILRCHPWGGHGHDPIP